MARLGRIEEAGADISALPALPDGKIVLVPHNASLSDMVFDPAEVQIFGKVVTVMRKL